MKNEIPRLAEVIEFWRGVAKEGGLRARAVIDRIDLSSKEIVDIVGPRRSGKSSVLKLLIQDLEDGFLYINFEDPFFIENKQPGIIEDLIAVYKEYFSPTLKSLFLDEIQVVEQWERAIRKLRDGGEYKIYVTGSSSKLLGSETAALLTGRHLSYQVMPLSFAEYLRFKNVEFAGRKDLLLKRQSLLKLFSSYLNQGGFPAIVLTDNRELLKQYFFDIIQKDIIARHSIREKGILERMAVFLISNAAKTTSMESLKKTFHVSYRLVASFIDYFKESFLIFELPQFSYSLKKQEKALKKFYAVDCGLANAVSFRFSEDRGRMLENCVFLHLQRGGEPIYYYRTRRNLEVDFFLSGDQKGKKLIQVAWELKDEATKDREIRALSEAMAETKLSEGLILTFDEEDEVKVAGGKISIRPAFKWFLEVC